MDITGIPTARGFTHLAAVLDSFDPCVLAWGLSITLEADFRIDAAEEAWKTHRIRNIFHRDTHAIDTGSRLV